MIVSSATAPGVGDINEDGVSADSHMALVLDGVSQWFTKESGCHHGTTWYVCELARRIVEHAQRSGPLCDALADAIADVASLHRHSCDLANPWTPAAAVTILRESIDKLEYLVLADCVLVLEDRYKAIRVITDDRLALLDKAARHRDADVELRHQLARGFQDMRNRTGGYWIAASDPAAAKQALTGWFSRPSMLRAGLMTDGVSCLVDGYGVMNWHEALDILRGKGPDGLIEAVRHWELKDADCVRWPRSKRHDDASVAYCVFSPADAEASEA